MPSMWRLVRVSVPPLHCTPVPPSVMVTWSSDSGPVPVKSKPAAAPVMLQ